VALDDEKHPTHVGCALHGNPAVSRLRCTGERPVALRPRFAAGLPLLKPVVNSMQVSTSNVGVARRTQLATCKGPVRLDRDAPGRGGNAGYCVSGFYGMVVLTGFESVLSEPPLVYDFSAKYQTPEARLSTT